MGLLLLTALLLPHGQHRVSLGAGARHNLENASDIESALFGIGSTNLVKAKEPVVAQLNCLPGKKFFNRPEAFVPEPLVVEKFQRPVGPFC